MHQISNILNFQTFQQQKESKPRFSPNTLSVLWLAMAEAFGTRWTKSMGDLPTATWEAGLRDLNDKQIARGIYHVINSGDEWPPSLPKFKAHCKNCEGWESWKEYVPMLTKEMTDDERKEYAKKIQNLRNILSENGLD